MKKLLSIPLAMLVLLSGMHFYIATHICKGEVTSTKWSFLAKTTGCGMEETSEACPIHKTISSKCCQTQIEAYSTENNFESSSIQLKDLSKNLLQIFNIPLQFAEQSLNPANIFNANSSPPNSELLSEVSLPGICVFRI